MHEQMSMRENQVSGEARSAGLTAGQVGLPRSEMTRMLVNHGEIKRK